jgi:hypothetical protein
MPLLVSSSLKVPSDLSLLPSPTSTWYSTSRVAYACCPDPTKKEQGAAFPTTP